MSNPVQLVAVKVPHSYGFDWRISADGMVLGIVAPWVPGGRVHWRKGNGPLRGYPSGHRDLNAAALALAAACGIPNAAPPEVWP